jgi:hypothetical protein
MKPSKRVVTKSPSNTSSANPKQGKSYTASPQPVIPKEKKPKAKTIGYDSRSARGVKKLNPSTKQTMRRPGLVTSKATGG